MLIEGVLENLIASAIGAIFLFVASKLLHDWFYVEIRMPNKKNNEMSIPYYNKVLNEV